MGHSKDIAASHSKDLTDTQRAALVRDLVSAWGQVEVPALRETPPAALVGLATRAVVALADAEILSPDQSAELQGRIQALAVLAAPAEFAMLVTDALPDTLFEALSSTLPDTSLATSWNVLLTAIVATAAVLAATVTDSTGADVAAHHVLVAWPGWVATA
ncbi:hypothetical protein [Dactylosporangium sp. CA-092794]|uniref:hypothetical protein n=1 Tax=Dactylosporangium sp. CA-092794 TaxID=3239929 RepID=UPI003D9166FB